MYKFRGSPGMIGRRRTEPEVTEEPKPKSFDDFEVRLGDAMRGERATLGKSLLDVQRELKIKASYIAAIENADHSAFETPGFIAGYVRSYARYLGMDADWAFQVFCAESGFVPTHGLAAQASGQRSGQGAGRAEFSGDPLANPNATFIPRSEGILAGIEPGAVGSVAVLIALIGLIGFGGWSVMREIQQVQFAPVEQSAGVLEELDDFSQRNTEIADVTGGAGLNTPPSVEALDRLFRPEALDVPVLIARDGPISTLDPREVGALGDTTATAAANSAPNLPVPGGSLDTAIEATVAQAVQGAGNVQVLAAGAPEVSIFAVHPAWVRVKSASGTVIFEKNLDACEHYALPATETPPLLRTGYAGAVYFSVNGQVYGPAGSGATIAKNVVLGAAELTEAFAPADPAKDAALGRFIAAASELGPESIPASICAGQ